MSHILYVDHVFKNGTGLKKCGLFCVSILVRRPWNRNHRIFPLWNFERARIFLLISSEIRLRFSKL